MPILTLDNISFRYGKEWIIRDVSLEIEKGQFLGIIGPNGSGKTTLLKLIDGLLVPQAGRILLESRPLREFSRESLARAVAVVPQDSMFAFPFTVEQVVLMGRAPHLGNRLFESKRDIEIAASAMRMTDTRALAGRSMHELSGGERQWVLIARALAQEPRIILLDEPTAFLDLKHQVEFFDLIKSLSREKGLTVVSVTHDVNLAAAYSDTLVLLKAGTVLHAGPPGEVITKAYIECVYGIEVFVDTNPVSGLPRVIPLTGQTFSSQSF